MKETITFKSIDSKDEVILPIHYNHIIQAMIYNQLNEEVAEFCTKKGFKKKSGPPNYLLFETIR